MKGLNDYDCIVCHTMGACNAHEVLAIEVPNLGFEIWDSQIRDFFNGKVPNLGPLLQALHTKYVSASQKHCTLDLKNILVIDRERRGTLVMYVLQNARTEEQG